MSKYIPKYYSYEIANKVKELAVEINDQYINPAEQPLIVCVMKGALFFCSDLYSYFDKKCGFTYCSYSSYTGTEQTFKQKEVIFPDQENDLKLETVLVIDDICDSGHTLAKICSSPYLRQAKEIKSVALINRAIPGKIYTPDWFAFESTDPLEWFVGYGMDDNQQSRNLKSICIIDK